jgi:hypothetical protein
LTFRAAGGGFCTLPRTTAATAAVVSVWGYAGAEFRGLFSRVFRDNSAVDFSITLILNDFLQKIPRKYVPISRIWQLSRFGFWAAFAGAA